MLHVDDGQLHAYLDGELAALGLSESDIEQHFALCAECRARLDAARRLRDSASVILSGSDPLNLGTPTFEEVVARRSAPSPEQSRGRRQPWQRALPWAASIMLALGLGWYARGLLLPPAEVAMTESAPAVAADSPARAPSEVAATPANAPTPLSEPVTLSAPAVARPEIQTSSPSRRQQEPTVAVAEAVAAPPAIPTREAAVAATRDVPFTAPPVAMRAAPADPTMIVRGRVITEGGSGVANAAVSIPSLSTATLTQADGSYALAVPTSRVAAGERLAVRVQSIGMVSDTLPLAVVPGDTVVHDFRLRQSAVALEELVVTGGAPGRPRRAPARGAAAGEPDRPPAQAERARATPAAAVAADAPPAESPAAAAQAAVAAAAYLREKLRTEPEVGSGVVAVDPRVAAADNPPARASIRWLGPRAAPANESLARAAGVSIRPLEQTFMCGATPATCRLEGAAAFLALGEPVLQGDSGTIEVTVFSRTGYTREPVAQKGVVLDLVRDGSGWRVVRERLRWIT